MTPNRFPTHSTDALDFFNESQKTFEHLANRWKDESEYENINDYLNPLKEIAARHNVTLIKMNKKPFGCFFSVSDGREYQIKVTTKQYSYSRTK